MIYILPTDTCFWLACWFDDKKNYHKIYKIKKRSFYKPLAIMVENFKWLEKNTDLTDKQVDFLKNYEKPFTILTNSDNIRVFLNFEESEDGKFQNDDVYNQIAFRVAHTPEQKRLIKKLWPIWLTSANLSNKQEVYSLEEIEKQFEYYLERWIIKNLGKYDLEKTPSSDVFEFDGESLEVNYLRKNT